VTRRTLLALAAVALLCRVLAALALGGSFHFADEAIYADAAQRLTAGHGFTATYAQAPGFPALLALLPGSADSGILLIRLELALIAVLGCWLMYVMASRMFGQKAAMLAVAFYALDPLLVVSAALL